MRDFGHTRYCKKCGSEILVKGETYTMTADSKFCECDKIKMSLNKDIWKQSKLAGEYPKDYLVIPALDVNDLIRQRVEELKEGFITGRHWDEKDIIYFINKTFGDKLV